MKIAIAGTTHVDLASRYPFGQCVNNMSKLPPQPVLKPDTLPTRSK